jgi:hypothetical protein
MAARERACRLHSRNSHSARARPHSHGTSRPSFHRPGGNLHPRVQAELIQDSRHVGLNRPDAQHHSFGYLAVGFSLRDQGRHLALARCQPAQVGRSAAVRRCRRNIGGEDDEVDRLALARLIDEPCVEAGRDRGRIPVQLLDQSACLVGEDGPRHGAKEDLLRVGHRLVRRIDRRYGGRQLDDVPTPIAVAAHGRLRREATVSQ